MTMIYWHRVENQVWIITLKLLPGPEGTLLLILSRTIRKKSEFRFDDRYWWEKIRRKLLWELLDWQRGSHYFSNHYHRDAWSWKYYNLLVFFRSFTWLFKILLIVNVDFLNSFEGNSAWNKSNSINFFHSREKIVKWF